jgi:hypothetical protein
MNDDVRLEALIRAALPPMSAEAPSRNLWPAVVRRFEPRRTSVPWVDIALAIGVGGALAVFPQMFLPLVFHL